MLCDFKGCKKKQTKDCEPYCKQHKGTPIQDLAIKLIENRKNKILTRKAERAVRPSNTYGIGKKTKKPKSNRPIKERKQKAKELRVFAAKLRKNIPKSEQWFYAFYSKDSDDFFNIPFAGYIPDVTNKRWKYIIEIDGSWHERPEQIQKDKRKDGVFKEHGYLVVRIKYNPDDQISTMESLKQGLSIIYNKRNMRDCKIVRSHETWHLDFVYRQKK